MTAEPRPKVHIPEVLPPEDGPEPAPSRPPSQPQASRIKRVLAGLMVDAADFVLRGPAGVRVGLPVGFVLGFVLGHFLDLNLRQSLVLGVLAGLYCAVPGTGLIPLGTLIALTGRTPAA